MKHLCVGDIVTWGGQPGKYVIEGFTTDHTDGRVVMLTPYDDVARAQEAHLAEATYYHTQETTQDG